MSDRLATHIEVSGLLRAVNTAGGFGMVVARGEAETGALLVVLTERGAGARAYERMPSPDGARVWHCARRDDADAPGAFAEYLDRRRAHDSDLWIIELDVAQGERFIGLPPTPG